MRAVLLLTAPLAADVVRECPAARFWMADGRVLAGMNVNIRDVNDAIQQLVCTGRPVDRAALADPHVPVDQLTTG
ncbi:hypothetical protein O1M07_33575 [Streptomyces albulus]|nr:oxidoreductase C-terminal domain-containing protein [Streptomyces noursei]MCZ1019009.1 hypothetical protein [Streptomyces noursei]